MLEKILLAAYEYENHLPPVRQRETTGWWPHYDKDYPDEPTEHYGSLEAFEFLLLLPLTTHQRRVIASFCGTGSKVSEAEAVKVYSGTSRDEYNEILGTIEACCPHTIKRIAQMFTA